MWKVVLVSVALILWYPTKFAAEKDDLQTEVKMRKITSHSEFRSKKLFRARRPGVMILGMHRSGTSMLSGLVFKMGFQIGDLVMEATNDNPRGYFENLDVVYQNDWFFAMQNGNYSSNSYRYEAIKGVTDYLNNKDDILCCKHGKKALSFFNNATNYPWMMKDPRLCITIRTWLPLLNFIPAVLFTYRHPLDVALSMHKRDPHLISISKGLRLWYVYNKRAVTQTHDLCRVITSYSRLMRSTHNELNYIYQKLRECGVPVKKKPLAKDLSSFVDVSLQHRKTENSTCEQKVFSPKVPPSGWDPLEKYDVSLYREVIRAYCALEDGTAFHPGFIWNLSITDS